MKNLTQEPGENKVEEELGEEQPLAPGEPEALARPTVVEIKTPLDRPEFDWFLETFMQKMGLTDRKQSAIALTNMFYDMGLDPYSELKDLQGTMEEMNSMLKNLPNTPTSMKVKDTLGGMFAAKTGRAILERMPRFTNQDPMMDKMERIMDKYMPMIMGMKMVGELMRAEPGQQKTQPQAQTELPEAVKTEITELKQSVANITELLSKQRANEEQKELSENIVKTVNSVITPRLLALESQVTALATQPPTSTTPNMTEMQKISASIKDAVDKLGEKAGAKGLTLADVDPIISLIERLEARFKKEPQGEFDWKTTTVSTLGEIGTELVRTYKEVETAKAAGAPKSQAQAPSTTLNPEMQAIIKRQVQNYILARIQTGAATMNIQEAAQNLGLTPEHVSWAYQILMAEGWINVRTAPPQKKPKGVGDQNAEAKRETEQPPETEQPFIET